MAQGRLSEFLDALTAQLSWVIGVTEVGVSRVVHLARAASETSDISTWEKRLNAAIVLASTLLVWLFLLSVQVMSRKLVEFVTEAINTALTGLNLPTL